MNIEELKQTLINKGKKIVFPEGEDARVLTAAMMLKEENIANPILLGNEQKIQEIAQKNQINIQNLQIIDFLKLNNFDFYVNELYKIREGKNTYKECCQMLQGANYFAVLMLKLGECDAALGGATYSTAQTVRPALQILKAKKGVNIVSSCFLMQKEGQKDLIFADCAININPTPENLCDIAISSAASAKVFNLQPKVAFLSFSTKLSAKSEEVDKVINAVELLKQKNPDFLFDGELQFDAAISKNVANKKAPNSPLNGDANVFIFPNLDAGNIAYKTAQYLGGYEALGPILQGISRPINDLSRGCSVQDIYKMAIITLCQN